VQAKAQAVELGAGAYSIAAGEVARRVDQWLGRIGGDEKHDFRVIAAT
jgi:hypothetical protein